MNFWNMLGDVLTICGLATVWFVVAFVGGGLLFFRSVEERNMARSHFLLAAALYVLLLTTIVIFHVGAFLLKN